MYHSRKSSILKLTKYNRPAFIGTFLLMLLPSIYFIYQKNLSSNECTGNVLASGVSGIGGDFILENIHGKTQHSNDIITKPSLIYFGYSFCPDICPFDLQRNVIAVDILAEIGLDISPIFITIDPKRDTTERLKEYSKFIHPKLISLTGSQDAIDDAMNTFKVYGKKSKSTQSENETYLMDHSAFTYLVDSSNDFIDFFRRQVGPEEMAEKIRCLLNYKV